MTFEVYVTRNACFERLNECYPPIRNINNFDNPGLSVTVIPVLLSLR